MHSPLLPRHMYTAPTDRDLHSGRPVRPHSSTKIPSNPPTCQVLNLLEQLHVVLRGNGYGAPRPAGTCRTPHAVHVVLGVLQVQAAQRGVEHVSCFRWRRVRHSTSHIAESWPLPHSASAEANNVCVARPSPTPSPLKPPGILAQRPGPWHNHLSPQQAPAQLLARSRPVAQPMPSSPEPIPSHPIPSQLSAPCTYSALLPVLFPPAAHQS